MGNVVSLVEHKPHCTGKAKCLACDHQWIAVVEKGECFFPCPECDTDKGVFLAPVEHDGQHWKCNCGNYHFLMTPDRIYCPNCGNDQSNIWED